jgi:hypothetical protein
MQRKNLLIDFIIWETFHQEKEYIFVLEIRINSLRSIYSDSQFKKSHSHMILYSTIIIFIKVFAIPALN